MSESQEVMKKIGEVMDILHHANARITRAMEELKKLSENKQLPVTGATTPSWDVRSPNRLSPVLLKTGAKRPAVISLQWYLDLEKDGIFGPATEEAVKEFQKSAGLNPDGIVGPATWKSLIRTKQFPPMLIYRIYEWVAWVETGTRQDSFGMAEGDIGDGAGANYGVVQHNSRGSLETLLKQAGRQDLLDLYQNKDKDRVLPEIKRWMGSQEGIKAQLGYFKGLYDKACQWISTRRWMWGHVYNRSAYERLVCLLTDISVQNGSLYSPHRTPEWSIFDDAFLSHFDGRIDDPAATLELIHRAVEEQPRSVKDKNAAGISTMLIHVTEYVGNPLENMAIAIACYRSSCSRPKYADRVLARKLTIATGEGKVHGSEVSMFNDFGIG